MPIPLEDNFPDIISKAQRGLKISDSALSLQTGLDAAALQKLRVGDFEAGHAERVAWALGLNAPALIAAGEKKWAPTERQLEGWAMFNTPFEDMTVNAYLLWDRASDQAIAFDTGADAAPMLECLQKEKLRLKWIFLTHTHGDHIFDLDRLKERTGAPAYVSEREPIEGAEPIAEGAEFTLGKLHLRALLTSGHSVGGLTYFVKGLAQPVAIVGDSLFAGSMGGGMVSYADALRNNREKILTLPEETVVCPGHGPLTTVGEEKLHNPFFAP